MAFLQKWFRGSASTPRKKRSATVEDLCHRFSLAQLRKSTNGFAKNLIIHDGIFYGAYKGCISINGELKDITVEWVDRASRRHLDLQLIKNNILYRCQLDHPNVAPLVGFCDDRDEMILVYDYYPNGSLYDQLSSRSATLSWKKRLEICIGVARGLHYLHCGTKRTLIHRDVTPSAILLDDNWVPKLGFCGFSLKGPKFSEKYWKPIESELPIGLGFVSDITGYSAPECLRGLYPNVTHKSDVYSFGAVLFELICGKTLSQTLDPPGFPPIKELLNLVHAGRAEEIIDQSLMGEIGGECWELYMEIAESCLSEDPNERPDMGDVEVQLERLLQLQEEADANRAFHAFQI